MKANRRNEGFSLIELLVVVMVLGVLGTVVVAAIGGFASEAADSGCAADAHTLATAAEAYFADRSAQTIPATGTTADRYEVTLANEGFIHEASRLHDLDASGQLVQVPGSDCVT